MATNVANQQLPYTEIKPLPFPVKSWPNLRLGFNRMLLVIATTGVSIGAGATLGLGTMAFTVLNGAIAGGVVGLVMGVFFALMIHFPSPLAGYRVKTLEQMAETTTNPRVLNGIKTLKQFLSRPLNAFAQTFHNHYIHNEVTAITEKVDRERPDIVKVWETFLNHLDGKKVFNPDGNVVKLDFSMELTLLKTGEKAKPDIRFLDVAAPGSDKDLAAIEAIQRESFGSIGTFPKDLMRRTLQSDPQNRCIVARHKGKIIGFAWAVTREGEISISGVARRPNAAHLGLGDQLLGNLLMQLPDDKRISLYVRESNPAVQLYERWGFEVAATLPHYYLSGPAEGGHLMRLNREKFEEVKRRISDQS